MAVKLSVIVICKNEESFLGACLESVSWADEIVVLDSGSTDKTLEVARRHTPHVFVNSDWQGFGIQKQRAQEKATGAWILSLDADEHVSPNLRDEIQRVIQGEACVYWIPRLSYCFGKPIYHGGWYPDYIVRLYPRDQARFNRNPVHEAVEFPAALKEKYLSHPLIHTPYTSVVHFLQKSAHYAQLTHASTKIPLISAVGHGIWAFMRGYVFKRGFLDGRVGLLLAILSSYAVFAKYAKLWVEQNTQSN